MSRSATTLLKPQRHALILRHLKTHEGASIRDLVALTGLSESTIRRDLSDISERVGGITRLHGGVISESLRSATYEAPAALAEQLNVEAKKAIAAKAAALIEPGASVIVDSGSTTVEFVKALIARGTACTIVTNDVLAAKLLANARAVTCIVLGGTLRLNTHTLYGGITEEALRDMQADLLILGTHAIDADSLSESSLDIARVKRLMIGAARRVVLLVDATKFDSRAFARVVGLGAIGELVTDRMPHGSLGERLKAMDIVVHIADAFSRP